MARGWGRSPSASRSRTSWSSRSRGPRTSPTWTSGSSRSPGATPLLTTALFVPPSVRTAPKGDFSGSDQARDNQTADPQQSFLARLLTGELDAGTYSTGEGSIPLKEVAKFPFVALSMDVAVWSKDKIPRMVITDGQNVSSSTGSSGDVLEPEWTWTGTPGARSIFSVQLADLDGDGMLHVVVNRYHPIPADPDEVLDPGDVRRRQARRWSSRTPARSCWPST